MNRSHYIRAVIKLYLEQHDTPSKATANDWAIASDLFRRGLPLELVLHAIRLAAVRRTHAHDPLSPVSSLAYYRRVLERLGPNETDGNYRNYIAEEYRRLRSQYPPNHQEPSDRSHNAALSRRR